MKVSKNKFGDIIEIKIDESLTTKPIAVHPACGKFSFPVTITVGEEMVSMDKEGAKQMIEALVKAL